MLSDELTEKLKDLYEKLVLLKFNYIDKAFWTIRRTGILSLDFSHHIRRH